MNKNHRNKYPKVNFDEAVNFDKRFAEHLLSKKNNGEQPKVRKVEIKNSNTK